MIHKYKESERVTKTEMPVYIHDSRFMAVCTPHVYANIAALDTILRMK